MAGIGFELRKIVGKGHISSVFQAAVSGVMIVSGPWLLSILSITVITRSMNTFLGDTPAAFLGAIVYCYAFSLIIFGGLHYVFTRIIADKIYEKRENEAARIMLLFLALIAAASIGLTLPFLQSITPLVPHPGLFRTGFVLLFVLVNSIWVLMIFITLLREYTKILVIYMTGMGSSILFVFLLGSRLGLSGSLIGFAAGHGIIALSLLILALKSYPPARSYTITEKSPVPGRTYLLLFFCGFFYSTGIWIDKILYWIHRGGKIPGTMLKVYEQYDIAVYFATLTMIPGLVYFIIISETAFYIHLRKFLMSLNRGRYAVIQRRKYRMLTTLSSGLTNQTFFQGVITLGLIIMAPLLISRVFQGSTDGGTLRITLSAVFFHLLFITTVNFQFYLELYENALVSCILFFILNTGITLLDFLPGLSIPPGLGYLVSGAAGSVLALVLLFGTAKMLDRRILSRSMT